MLPRHNGPTGGPRLRVPSGVWANGTLQPACIVAGLNPRIVAGLCTMNVSYGTVHYAAPAACGAGGTVANARNTETKHLQRVDALL